MPIDSSAQSLMAQNMAMFLANKFRSQVTIMHVVPNEPVSLPQKNYVVRENYAPISTATGQFPRTLTPAPIKEYAIPEEVAKEIAEGYLSEGQTLLSEATQRFSAENIATRKRLVEATDTADSIISEAKSGAHDLVIMGNSEGEKKELDFHLGSVAERVSSLIKIPILIVRQKTAVTKILVPTDGSKKDQLAMQEAAVIAKVVGAKVVLLHVQEASHLRLKPEVEETGFQTLKDAAAKFGELAVEQKLASGDPAKVIIHTVDQDDADLIVMAAGGRGSLRNRFLGGVSSHVLHYAKVPVLLVK